MGVAAAAALLLGPPTVAPALASDTAKVGACLLSKCQRALAGCLADAQCAENLVCLQLCEGTDDVTACQIKCGDKYADRAIETFTSCAVSEEKCVPQRVDEALYPVPPESALDKEFDLSNFQGRWYITAGLNPLFDTFDCQAHYFASPEPGKLYAKINWRIPRGPIDFIERSTMQRFVQVPSNPALLLNHDNEFLHYQDDWYILASKPDEYVFIYYRGQNDAWKGYGGATVYTRAPALPAEYVPELRAAAERAGVDWSAMTLTDNSCKPHPTEAQLAAAGRARLAADVKELGQELEKEAEQVEERVVQEVRKDVGSLEYELEGDLKSFGKGFTVLEKDLEGLEQGLAKGLREEEAALTDTLKKEEEALATEVSKAGRMIRRFEMEAEMKWVQALPMWLREVIMPVF